MAASTTVKVAQNTGAAKDDIFTSLQTGLSEDSLSAKLNVLANDPGSAALYSLLQSTAGLAAGSTMPKVLGAVSKLGAAITINADGTIGYDASGISASLQSLHAGESTTDSFTYTIRMANGALSTATVSLQLAGANDIATIDGDDHGTATEDGAGAHGTLAVHDLDHDESAFQPGVTATSEFGDFSFDNGAWSYGLRNGDANVQALRGGEQKFETITVTSLDGTASKTVTVTVVGTNDLASISGNANGNVAEDGTLSASGNLSVSDVDTGENTFAGVDSNALHGVYGDFSFDTATGAWSYALRNGDANVQALNGGDTVSDSLVVSSLDGTAQSTIVVNIAGVNEAAAGGAGNEVPANPVTSFHVTRGNNDVNALVFNGFDSNDILSFANNLQAGAISAVDTNGDNVADTTLVHFSYKSGNFADFDVKLVGLVGLDASQLVAG
jgi:VCBS repeat-containing protein